MENKPIGTFSGNEPIEQYVYYTRLEKEQKEREGQLEVNPNNEDLQSPFDKAVEVFNKALYGFPIEECTVALVQQNLRLVLGSAFEDPKINQADVIKKAVSLCSQAGMVFGYRDNLAAAEYFLELGKLYQEKLENECCKHRKYSSSRSD